MSTLRKALWLVTCPCLLNVLLAPTAAAQDVTFAAPEATATGEGAESLVAGDWNGDETIDLAVANRDAGTLSILLNDGEAVFTVTPHSFVGSNPRPFKVISGDFDRDGKVDLAVALEGTDQVAILLGNGAGVFASPVTYLVGDAPGDLAAGDFDGLNGPDLITANRPADVVSVVLNNGDGTYGAATDIDVIDPNLNVRAEPTGVVVADFNKDGKADFAVANHVRDQVAVRLGNGDGTFGALTTFATEANGDPWGLVAADLNADGNTDLAVANWGADTVSVLLGVGNGTFLSSVQYAAGNAPMAVIAVDVDDDGKLDLVTANREGDDVTILFGDGDGAFQAPQSAESGNAPTGVVAADLNADGKVDLATANEETDNMTVLLAGTAGGPIIVGPGLFQCPGLGFGPLGLLPYALTFCGLVGLKRLGRQRGW